MLLLVDAGRKCRCGVGGGLHIDQTDVKVAGGGGGRVSQYKQVDYTPDKTVEQPRPISGTEKLSRWWATASRFSRRVKAPYSRLSACSG